MHYVTFQFSGGTILHMPYAPAIDDTVLRYLIGSENSSSEGQYVGTSIIEAISEELGNGSSFVAFTGSVFASVGFLPVNRKQFV